MSNKIVVLKMSDVFKGFQVELRTFYKNRVYVQHHLHIQPSEIDALCFYEYQWMLKDLIEMLKEQNGENGNKTDNEFDVNSQIDKIKSQSSKYNKGMNLNLPKLGKFKL